MKWYHKLLEDSVTFWVIMAILMLICAVADDITSIHKGRLPIATFCYVIIVTAAYFWNK